MCLYSAFSALCGLQATLVVAENTTWPWQTFKSSAHEPPNLKILGSIDSSSFVSWIDMHENTMASDGTMLVTGYNVTQTDLSSVGGPKNGWIADSLFYEIDVNTNEILFRWSALEHVDQIPLKVVQPFYPIRDWGHSSSSPYGYFHINSVDKFQDGTYISSSRYYCSLDTSGKFKLLQGQTGGDFALNGIKFSYQHDACIHDETHDAFVLSIFDNSNSDVQNGTDHTEGILMNVNLATREVSLLQTLHDQRDEIFSTSQGNIQLLPTDHVLMGYESNPKIHEYNTNGTCVMIAQFGFDDIVASYRAYRFPWVGVPDTLPDVFSCID
ncbi:hypothetical protein N7471_002604 [Penicillium samsonianum]|uniref:uncharacterized protein n=1 Tax=Penicillium samsonianum TaxID=1882272 RepID=UPI00254871F6|nr:uncharacterized protein N7471_002604 [Penicillium samsonianum]KAJ6143151.1 hypothetical protein N7471_002604 [Penicillium samsonianum]